jgi:peptide/nickel transport system substrate-binding protein
MKRRRIVLLLVLTVLTLGWAQAVGAQAKPSGEFVWALHVTISPSWFDPGENGGLITPFAVLYALHDGVVRPMPGQKIGNSLAESWTESPDGLVYEFTLHPRLTFRNGTPLTATDAEGVRRGPHRRRPAGGSIGTGPDSDVRLVWTG